MKYHRYPLRSLIWDYVRAIAGFLIAIVPLTFGAPGIIFLVFLLALAALFAGYGLRTLRQQFTAYEIVPEGIVSHGLVKRFHEWAKTSKVQLRYYSTSRDKSKRDLKRGWMELKLVSDAGTLRIDSDVEGFDEILEATSTAITDNKIEVDETTEENFKAFRGEDAAPPPAVPPAPSGTGTGL